MNIQLIHKSCEKASSQKATYAYVENKGYTITLKETGKTYGFFARLWDAAKVEQWGESAIPQVYYHESERIRVL